MIDTIQIARNLEDAGFTKSEAEAIAQSMLEIPDWANLATKSDLAVLKADLNMERRFDELHRMLLQLQSDLHTFYRELGYHDARLDNLEKP